MFARNIIRSILLTSVAIISQGEEAIATESEGNGTYENAAEMIIRCINNSHNESCSEIISFAKGAAQDRINKNRYNKTLRNLRDNFGEITSHTPPTHLSFPRTVS